MILIVSSQADEADALAALCEQRAWPSQVCKSVSEFLRLAERTSPRVVIARQRLADGHSDDVLNHLGKSRSTRPPRVIVLAPADCSIKEETRHVSLGADHVFRDPVRIEVLLEVVNRHRDRGIAQRARLQVTPLCFDFAGVQVFPHEHRLVRGDRSVCTTPRVIELLQLLHANVGQVTPYPLLYSELFDRRFSGDTVNCRVLLAKAAGAFRRLGGNLRRHIKVIPKSGYLYSPSDPDGGAPASSAPTSPK